MSDGDTPDPRDGPRAAIEWFLHTENGYVVFLREMLSSALAVLLVGIVLFSVSGLWPPLVAVESGSMHPHLKKGDLVFVMDQHRLSSSAAYGHTGVVTYDSGKRANYRKFHGYGDVIVYERDGRNGTTPVIHRARFWVNKSENWYPKANPQYLDPQWHNCQETPNCPAPDSGFITKGDANPLYDQVWGISKPVHPSWIRGKAVFRVPWLGWIRLKAAGVPTGVAFFSAGHVSGTAAAAHGPATAPAHANGSHPAGHPDNQTASARPSNATTAQNVRGSPATGADATTTGAPSPRAPATRPAVAGPA